MPQALMHDVDNAEQSVQGSFSNGQQFEYGHYNIHF